MYITIDSPIGILSLSSDKDALTRISFAEAGDGEAGDSPVLSETARQLTEYFEGKRREFSVPLRPIGTPFQTRVWEELLRVPYGETATYGDIARRIGSPKACRAVGQANNKNPIPIIIPCHRIIGASGKLVGYAGGTDIKTTLLLLEGAESFSAPCNP